MPNVFVYGTLLVPELMQVVSGGDYESAEAIAHGYARSRLAGRVYPGIAAAAGSQVPGRIYLSLTEEALRRLDYFEGPEYIRDTLEVVLQDGSRVPAETYIVPAEKRSLLTGEVWGIDSFRACDYRGFLDRAREIMRSYAAGGQQ